MNWNMETDHLRVRLPVTDTDGDALFELLKDPDVSAHVPKAPMFASVQGLDELRRATMQFQARQGVTWLIERQQGDGVLLARVRLSQINWMTLSAQVQWELSPTLTDAELDEAMFAVHRFCFGELSIHRLDMRIRPGSDAHTAHLKRLGYEYEGCLPAQLEFEDEWVDQEIYSLLSN